MSQASSEGHGRPGREAAALAETTASSTMVEVGLARTVYWRQVVVAEKSQAESERLCLVGLTLAGCLLGFLLPVQP